MTCFKVSTLPRTESSFATVSGSIQDRFR